MRGGRRRLRGRPLSRFLITGGAGFIGLHLARHILDQGDAVDLADNLSRGKADEDLRAVLRRPGVRFVEVDLLQPSSLSRLPRTYSHIVHLAALLGVDTVLRRSLDVLRQNVEMLESVLDLAREQPLERLVFASTSEVYSGTLRYFDLPLPTPEDTPLAVNDLTHPRTSYMLSKIYGEALCQQAGLPFTIVRPHNVYGPRMGMAHVVPELLRRIYRTRDGDEVEIQSIEHRRTFCYVSDAAEQIARLAIGPEAQGNVFNVGCEGPEIPMGELAQELARVVDRRVRFRPGPEASGSVPRRCPSMVHTNRVTGFTTRVSLEEGLRLTFAWYRDQGLLDP